MSSEHAESDAIARRLAAIALEAGLLLQRMRSTIAAAKTKSDGSPSTEADLAAEALILKRLTEFRPDIPTVAEESGGKFQPMQPFFLIDPLDGTRDYLRPTGEYCVNIALIAERRPIAAAIAAPEWGKVWCAGTSAMQAILPPSSLDALPDPDTMPWGPIRTRPHPLSGLVALSSRSHKDAATAACLASLPIQEVKTVSSAVKFCLIAAGEADIYIRCGTTMEWDTAAGEHILERAGGCLIAPGGSSFLYGRTDHGLRNGAFAALGDPTLAGSIVLPDPSP